MVEKGFIDFDKPTEEVPGGPPTVTNDRAARSVREFCVTWARAVRTICLYPPTNPLPDEFRAKFFDAVTLITEDHGRLVLHVTDSGFVLSGQNVYEDVAGEENLAYIFFKDGIREIGFEIGVGRLECDRFLEFTAEALAATGASIDLANRLWEVSFAHIKHYTVDRVIEGAYIEAAADSELSAVHEQFAGEVTVEPEPPVTPAAPVPASPYSGLQRERHLHIQKTFGDVTALTAAEKTEMVHLCRSESREVGESLGLDVLMEILRTADSTRALEETFAVMERQFEHAVAADHWEMARSIMIEMRGVMAHLPPRAIPRFNSALTRMADKKNFERLAQYLNTNTQANLGPIRDLLSLFGTAAITSVTAMLGTLEHRPGRMMVCDFLIANGRETVDLIGGFIYDKRWYVSRNVAMILGEIGNERGVTFLKKSAAHTDARVRLETLRAAKRILGEDAERILRGFLNDPDVDLRKRALRALGQRNSTAVVTDIKAQINPETLPERDPAEVRELLLTYGRLGGPEAAQGLIALARRKPFFKRARWQPVRLAAIRALGASMESEALTELENLTKDRAAEVADAARSAMTYRQKLVNANVSHDCEDDE